VKGPTMLKDLERAALVGACKWVDEIHPYTPYTPSLKLMDEYSCQYCAHGDDMPTNENGQDCYTEIKEAGRMKIFKRTDGISTTEIIGRLLSVSKNRVITKHEDSITGAELINKMNNFDNSPVVSKFLTTGWRFVEFCNNKVPKPGDKIVYLDGDFDILHTGYLETLEKAKKLGDFLYVGIHDDTTVNSYKGQNYPILNLQERVLNVLAMRYVDDVVISAPLKISELLIRSLGINIVVITNDLEKKEVVSDSYELASKMGLTVEVLSEIPLNNDIFIERVELNRTNYAKKFEKKKVAEETYIATAKFEIQEI